MLDLGGGNRLVALSDVKRLAQVKEVIVPADIEQIKALLPDGSFTSYVNAYLLQLNGRNILFDTGVGAAQGGNLLEALAAYGIKPGAIDMVVLTHLHIDHAGGLYNENKEVFNNAEVWIAKPEVAYWCDSQEFPATQKGSVFFARQALKVAHLNTFTPGCTITPGLQALPAFGHTPGHTAFLITTNEKRVLVWGDIMHVPAVQFARPEVGVVYDVNGREAVKTRQALLRQAQSEKVIVAGMHLPFPGWGAVQKPAGGGDAGYVFAPLD